MTTVVKGGDVMVLATFEDVMVAVEGLVEGSTVSLGIDENGLAVGGYGMLAWAGSRVEIEERAPHGLRICVNAATGAPSIFFVPTQSLRAGLSASMLARSVERLAVDAGATVEALSSV
jgi:hypothetical protein